MQMDRLKELGITGLFVRRPVLAFVINMLIVVAGIAAIFGIEVRELPDVDRPVITVSTDYPAAAAETIDREVTGVIEGAVARVSGVKSISSSSSFGRSRVTVEFSDDVDLDVAASDMRDALGRITNDLPEDAEPSRIIKADANAQPVLRLGLTSDRMSVEDMTVLVEDEISDVLAAVPGVADVQVYGDRDKIFRIDIDQAKMASLNLTIADVANALSSMAFDTPAGSLTSQNQDLIVRATASIDTPEEFESVIINRRARLRDFVTVTLGPDLGQTQLRANGKSGIGLGVIRSAQSNTLEISEGVRAAVDRIQENLPEGMTIEVTSDDATFINGAIHEVEIALAISVSIVLLIIFIFLWDWRATIIPGVSLPVALIGTLAAIYLAGFSINILTLLALVLATGLVVDDAIVVLENIVRRRNEGIGPRAAAVLGAEEVFFAVLATTATLIAVFVPLSFLPGQTGGLFREFGFVLAIAVFLSSIVALSLCPMLASRILKSKPAGKADDHGGGAGGLGRMLSALYRRCLHACLDAPMVVVAISLLFAATAGVLFPTIKSELTPTEDRSIAFMRISAPQGVSLDTCLSRCARSKTCWSLTAKAARSTAPSRLREQAVPRTAASSSCVWRHGTSASARNSRSCPRSARLCAMYRVCGPSPSSPTASAFAVPGPAFSLPSPAATTMRRSALRRTRSSRRWSRTQGSGRCACPPRPPSRSFRFPSIANAPPTLASTSTDWARPCRRCWTVARSVRFSSTTRPMT